MFLRSITMYADFFSSRTVLQSAKAEPKESISEKLCPIINTSSEPKIIFLRVDATTRVRTREFICAVCFTPPKNSKSSPDLMAAWSPPRLTAISSALFACSTQAEIDSLSEPTPIDSVIPPFSPNCNERTDFNIGNFCSFNLSTDDFCRKTMYLSVAIF